MVSFLNAVATKFGHRLLMAIDMFLLRMSAFVNIVYIRQIQADILEQTYLLYNGYAYATIVANQQSTWLGREIRRSFPAMRHSFAANLCAPFAIAMPLLVLRYLSTCCPHAACGRPSWSNPAAF